LNKFFVLLSIIWVSLSILSTQKPAFSQVTNVPLFIVDYDTQTGPSAVSPSEYYLSERIVESFAGNVDSVSLTYPNSGGPVPYPAPSGSNNVSFFSSPSYSSLSTLNGDFGFGDYTTTYSGNYTGSDTVDYTTNDLPTSTPTFTADTYNSLEGLNANNGTDLDFNAFTGALSNSYVFVNIYKAGTGADVFNAGGGFLPSGTTSVYLPGGTLDFDTPYYAILDFSNRDPASDANGVDVSQNWDAQTELNFRTAAAPEISSVASLAILFALGLMIRRFSNKADAVPRTDKEV
jgi:hypothetical protein